MWEDAPPKEQETHDKTKKVFVFVHTHVHVYSHVIIYRLLESHLDHLNGSSLVGNWSVFVSLYALKAIRRNSIALMVMILAKFQSTIWGWW